mgnify:FL=1
MTADGKVPVSGSFSVDSVTVSNEVEVKNDSGNPVPVTESNRYAVDGDDELIVHQKSASHVQADGLSNTRQVAAATDETALIINEVYNYLFNGTTWDRARGNATDGALVNLGANNDVTVTSGSITEANSAAILAALQTIDNMISGNEAQVDVVTSALPTGAATSANQSTEITHLSNIATYLQNRFGGGKTPVPFTVTASGDTTIHTPASGKAIRLFSIDALTDPDQSTTPLIKVLIGSTEKIRGHAIGKWEIFTGAADEVLKINLSEGSSVSGTAYIEEFTP